MELLSPAYLCAAWIMVAHLAYVFNQLILNQMITVTGLISACVRRNMAVRKYMWYYPKYHQLHCCMYSV